ncbi:MAG: L-rhamnonate dehydratase [Nitrospina sp.]|jgi:L-rhamnonate dehydratase|nr:L-rhamnonate dehydratase [Calditrichota bacterium]MBT3510299.1 L-rhamnonate dehydratase [Nitrospina sp.]MBT4048303.1 L-rhamnonate dehydratase [Nitrospina sp.]
MKRVKIIDVRAYVLEQTGCGGDYHDREQGHWLVDTLIATPMSAYPEYKQSRTSFGINEMKSIVVEIETSDGLVGISAGQGGAPACYIIEQHFRRFIVGQDPRNLNRIWDQMFRASRYYGGKGLPLWAISAVDLALWDLLGLLRQEPVYQMIGGAVREEIELYCTGIRPDVAKEAGFIGGKMPLPYGPADRRMGLNANVKQFREMRDQVGPDFQLMADCWMSLDVPYAVELSYALQEIGIYWMEEALHPDDFDGYKLLKERVPWMRWTSGEHEYTRYGFRKLIEGRSVDILQPDVMWCGGLTELLRISAMAAAYDIPVVPHGSGAYSYHFVVTQPHCPFCEYLNTSTDCLSFPPVFGNMFENEILPRNGKIKLTDDPGWGLKLNRKDLVLNRVSPASERKGE